MADSPCRHRSARRETAAQHHGFSYTTSAHHPLPQHSSPTSNDTVWERRPCSFLWGDSPRIIPHRTFNLLPGCRTKWIIYTQHHFIKYTVYSLPAVFAIFAEVLQGLSKHHIASSDVDIGVYDGRIFNTSFLQFQFSVIHFFFHPWGALAGCVWQLPSTLPHMFYSIKEISNPLTVCLTAG